MTKTKIKLNEQISIDLETLLDTKLLIQANSGGGKSWAIRRILEQSHGKVQQIVIDLEGEFATLREKYEYILAGKDGDVPAEPKSAAVLARKLLELKVSAIIDLSELVPQERKHFVRLFIDAMIDLPKDMRNHCLVVIDEAHFFCPEKGESEASSAVIDLCSRGRKRGLCAILATQRISKLNKDATAECNNKLVGRTGQDIDMKRAYDDLGFNSKEQFQSIKHLESGEFYAFGPAISREVIKLRVGGIATTHPKVGARAILNTTPPTAKIKSILAKLGDIPAEAKKKAQTEEELRKEIQTLRQHRCERGATDEDIKKAVDRALFIEKAETAQHIEYLGDEITKAHKVILSVKTTVESFSNGELKINPPKVKAAQTPFPKEEVFKFKPHTLIPPKVAPVRIEQDISEITFGTCEKKIYSFLVLNSSRAWSKTQVGIGTLYSPNSGGFNNSISKLVTLGLVTRENGMLGVGADNRDLIISISDNPLRDWLPKLSKCEGEIYEVLLSAPQEVMSKEYVAQATPSNYSPTSGGYNNSISSLCTLGLVVREKGGLRINPEVLEI